MEKNVEKESLTLKEKCERMRSATDYVLAKNRYAMAMIDGRSFSRLIKNNYEKPFDNKFINMMNEVAIYVCKNVQGCKFAYAQSDEITFVITDFETEKASAFFDYRLCKMQSIIASLATGKFNQLVTLNLLDTPCSQSDMKQMIADMKLAEFDCKVWDVDNFNDVFAYILWRQNDCIRNSKQQAAQTYLSHEENGSNKQLLGLNADEQIALLLKEKGIEWNNYDEGKKYGRFIYKEKITKQTPEGEDYTRSVWLSHNAFVLSDKDGKNKFIQLDRIPLLNFPIENKD